MKRNFLISIIISLVLSFPSEGQAQIGEHRSDLSIGVSGGYILSNVGFTPKVNQGLLGGLTGGFVVRYKSEKYFSTICSIQGEINYSQIGWKEDIIDDNNQAVINTVTGVAEEYSRKLDYIQIPIFAHLAWGKEYKGMNFFVNLGPQFGYLISEKTSTNFEFSERNTTDRTNPVVAQDTMKVEHSFDYGIAVGAGMEYSHPKIGHFLLEARYYYGLGNIYGNSKRDYFSKSNIGNIVIKATYLFDISRFKKR
jgi:hypothetical protein